MVRKTSWAIHGLKVKWAGLIFDGPHDVVGPISFRAKWAVSYRAVKWAICEETINRLFMGQPVNFLPSQTGRICKLNGPVVGRGTCRHIIGAYELTRVSSGQ